jgi:hypothetical protein
MYLREMIPETLRIVVNVQVAYGLEVKNAVRATDEVN